MAINKQTTPKIKICGFTKRDDAFLACELGVDAIGFVFYDKSKRFVQACDLKWIKQLPSFVQVVGLFVNPEQSFVNSISDQVAIDLLQFHGTESSDFCSIFKHRYIKAVPMQGMDKQNSIDFMAKYVNCSGFLLDNYGITDIGGSGTKFDWDKIPTNTKYKLIMAGGLNNTNVSEIIDKINPWGVDISSGVELSPGIKSKEKMEQFINIVKSK